MVTNYDGENIEFKEELPLLPIRDLVVYPYMILPLFVGRESSIKAVNYALEKTDRLILLSSQKDIQAESPTPDEIYKTGTVAMIMRMRKLPDGRVKILIQGLTKATITNFQQTAPFYKVKAQKIDMVKPKETTSQIEAVIRTVKENLEKVISLGKVLSPDILMILEDINEAGRLSDLIASNLNLRVAEAQMILETQNPVERITRINEILVRELEILHMQSQIKNNARDELNKNQKEVFLREQIKAIKSELGEEEKQDEFTELRDKIYSKNMTEEAEKEALKQLARLERMHPDSSESSILRTYLDWMVDLPWGEQSEEKTDLTYAKGVLDEDHYELEKIKERILEYLAVRSLKGGSLKGPILCFSGPPGVGKTSLGKSIAKATGREFVRISLGGVKDESEIRGHRRTYVGAMPGRFLQGMKQAKTSNPVIMLDEVDKLGSDYRGDPASALLEVLDPEQNNTFRDHYLNVAYDLSNVMFIATANILDSIPGPLRDRMEVINLSGYSMEEKLVISKKYLLPKQMEENGVTRENLAVDDGALETVISSFTREAGVRNLERQIGSLCRKVAKKIATGETEKTHIITDTVYDLLGPAQFNKEDEKEFDEVGVATGLAWTSVGGEILYVEATKMKGKGITLTGQLGEVMKESAQAAMGFIRANSEDLGIDDEVFENFEVHIHLPAGAIPKDGPSAGITLATTIVSVLTNSLVSKDIAMTGEITLTGKVLPIGGLKEKALAAMRAGIETVIIPWKNQKDLVEIPEEYRKKINFVPVKNFREVISIALLDWEAPKSKNKAKKSSKGTNKTSSIAA
ncbi:endopeptidase La [Bacteriovoracaceae bacterium]|nr:endopeptidase La [Bacteriovoracaceae bacterium]